MNGRALAAVLLTGAALAACSVGWSGATAAPRGPSKDARQASAFAARMVLLIAQNRYAEAWANLLPLHQQLVSLDRYVECENLTQVPGRPGPIRALRARAGIAHVPGLDEPVPAMKVELRIVIVDRATWGRVSFLKTVAVVKAGDRWAWFLPGARYATYAGGACPS